MLWIIDENIIVDDEKEWEKHLIHEKNMDLQLNNQKQMNQI